MAQERKTRDMESQPAQSASMAAMEAEVSMPEFERATHTANSDVTVRDMRRKRLAKRYENEEKVSVMVAPMYAAHFGRVMRISVNGIETAIPCDGKPYKLPETYAREVQRRLRAINEQAEKQSRYANVAKNVESSPGALELHT